MADLEEGQETHYYIEDPDNPTRLTPYLWTPGIEIASLLKERSDHLRVAFDSLENQPLEKLPLYVRNRFYSLQRSLIIARRNGITLNGLEYLGVEPLPRSHFNTAIRFGVYHYSTKIVIHKDLFNQQHNRKPYYKIEFILTAALGEADHFRELVVMSKQEGVRILLSYIQNNFAVIPFLDRAVHQDLDISNFTAWKAVIPALAVAILWDGILIDQLTQMGLWVPEFSSSRRKQ